MNCIQSTYVESLKNELNAESPRIEHMVDIDLSGVKNDARLQVILLHTGRNDINPLGVSTARADSNLVGSYFQ